MGRQGYREMLRDRCPRTVNYALKWQKAKDKWIDHAYTYFIKLLGDEINSKGNVIRSDKDNKRHVINLLLGIKKGKPVEFDFSKSVDWDNLSDEEKVYWERVSSWVTWFQKNYQYIVSVYNISKQKGKDDFDIQIEIIQRYLSWLLPSPDCTQEEKEAKYQYVDNLAEFLMKCIEGKIK